ncbi:MAG: hypothetical protein KDE53_29260 [Caldilineaceae bacterium]|nr:hypothetical protein [Caldilineaceae bacterium]
MISNAKFKQLTDYIISLGAADIAHTEKTYLAHAIGVYNDMKEWNSSDDLCYAALFHSIYGTQGFQGFTLPLEKRPELQALIGDYAEKLAFFNCFMDRATLDAQVREDKEEYPIRNRVTGELMPLTKSEYEDLICLHLCDLLEQVERSNAWNARRTAYRGMAERLGGVALTSYDEVFAREPVQAR